LAARKRALRSGLLLLVGFVLMIGSYAFAVAQSPVVVYGIPGDLETLSREEIEVVTVKFWNISASDVSVVTEAPGCTMAGEKYRETVIPSFCAGEIEYFIDPSTLKTGANDASLVIHVNGARGPMRLIRPLKFAVERGGGF
jgi:hypothetical protein